LQLLKKREDFPEALDKQRELFIKAIREMRRRYSRNVARVS
ncbi:hypothetical protein T10_12925, partial [Trichinella papuae]